MTQPTKLLLAFVAMLPMVAKAQPMPLRIALFANTDGTQAARLELTQGRVDAIVQSSESVPYTFAQDTGTFLTIDKPLAALSIAVALPKMSGALRDQVAAALREAVADGTYAADLKTYGLATTRPPPRSPPAPRALDRIHDA